YLGYLERSRDDSYRRRADERISMPASAPYGVITHTMDRPLYYLDTRVLTEEDLGNLNLTNLRSLSEEQIQSAGIDYLYSDKKDRVYLHTSGTGMFPAYSGLVDVHLGRDASGKVTVQKVQLKPAGWQKVIDAWIEKQAARGDRHPLVLAAVERSSRIERLQKEETALNAAREKARAQWRAVKNTLATLEASESEISQAATSLEARLQKIQDLYKDLEAAPQYSPILIGKYTAIFRQEASELGLEAQMEPVLDALSRLKAQLEDRKTAASKAERDVIERAEAIEAQYFSVREESKEAGRRIQDFQGWLDARGIKLPQAPSKLAASIAAGQKIEVSSTIPFVYPESKIAVPEDQLVADPALAQYLKDQQFKQVSAEFGYVREHSHGFSRVKYFTRDKEGRWQRIKEDFLPNYTLTIQEGLKPTRYFKFDQARKEFVEVSGESLMDYMSKNKTGALFQVSLWRGEYLTLDQIEQIRRDWAEGKSFSENVSFDQLYEVELRNFYQKNAVPGRWLKAKTPDGGIIATWVPEDQITIFDIQKEDVVATEEAKARRNKDQGYVVRTYRGLEWRAVPEAALKKTEAPKEGYWLILPGGSPFFVEKSDYQRLRAQAKNNAGIVTLKFENKTLQIRLDETKPHFARFGSFGFTVIEPSEAAVKRSGLMLPNYAPIPDEMVLPRHLALPHRPTLVNPQFDIHDFQEFLIQNTELFNEYQSRFDRQGSVDADLNQEIFNRLRQREPELRQKYAEFTRMYEELVKKFGYPADAFPRTMPSLSSPEAMHPGHAYAAILIDDLDPGAQWLVESALALYIRRLDPSIQALPWQLLTATKNIRSVGVMRENWQKIHAFESWYEYYSFPNIFVERPDVRKSPYLGDRVIPGYGPYIPAEHALLSHIGLQSKEIAPSEFTVGLKMTGVAGKLEDQKRDAIQAAALRYLQLSIVPGIEAQKQAPGVIIAIESMQSEAESEINRLRRLKAFGPREAIQLKKTEEFLSYLKEIADPANLARNDARDAASLSDEELKDLRYDLARAELQLQRLHSAGLLEAADGALKPLADYSYNRVIRPYNHLSDAEKKLLPKALHGRMAVEPDQFFFHRVENKKNVYDRLHFGVNGLHRFLTDTVKTKAADFRDGVPASDVYEASAEFTRLADRLEDLKKEAQYFQDAQLNLARRIRGAEFARYLKATYGFDARTLAPAVVKKEKEDIFKRATPQGFNAKLISERDEMLAKRDKALSDFEKLKKTLETKQRLSYHIIDDSNWDPYGPRKFYAVVLDQDRKVVEYIMDPSDVPANAFIALESAESQ
ncbi:MAG TPA: hypothetical protein VD883_01805, partial [Candidatus Omnitrophota bacterium]|nr:hypothetical protein [Candidatus Omnitrophota bacterium]